MSQEIISNLPIQNAVIEADTNELSPSEDIAESGGLRRTIKNFSDKASDTWDIIKAQYIDPTATQLWSKLPIPLQQSRLVRHTTMALATALGVGSYAVANPITANAQEADVPTYGGRLPEGSVVGPVLGVGAALLGLAGAAVLYNKYVAPGNPELIKVIPERFLPKPVDGEVPMIEATPENSLEVWKQELNRLQKHIAEIEVIKGVDKNNNVQSKLFNAKLFLLEIEDRKKLPEEMSVDRLLGEAGRLQDLAIHLNPKPLKKIEKSPEKKSRTTRDSGDDRADLEADTADHARIIKEEEDRAVARVRSERAELTEVHKRVLADIARLEALRSGAPAPIIDGEASVIEADSGVSDVNEDEPVVEPSARTPIERADAIIADPKTSNTVRRALGRLKEMLGRQV